MGGDGEECRYIIRWGKSCSLKRIQDSGRTYLFLFFFSFKGARKNEPLGRIG